MTAANRILRRDPAAASWPLAGRAARPAAESPVVRLTGVSKQFGGGPALTGIDLEVRPGEVLGVIGRSGAGKSTLIRCLNGLERPESGRVEILGRDIVPLGARQLRRLRGRVGMIFQYFNLLSAKTVAENVALPLKIAGTPKAARRQRVAELLDLVGLSQKADAYPAQLSGGQKQRVGIARALAAGPALLLCDEATSALDPETTQSILALLKDINRRLKLTIVLITHEMSVIRAVADRVVVLDHGRIVEEGPVWRVFADPKGETTRRLLGSEGGEPPPDLAAAATPQWRPGAELLVSLRFGAAEAGTRLPADLALRFERQPALVHSGLERIQDHLVGTLVLSIPVAGPDEEQHLVEFLKSRVLHLEVLGYVERPL